MKQEVCVMNVLLITMSALLLCAAPASAAPPASATGQIAFIAVDSQTAGSLTEGLGKYRGHEDEVHVNGFGFGFEGSYDEATGSLTGRPQPQPVRISKALDALTPLLLTEMTSGGTLQVSCRLYAADRAGREQLLFTAELNEARLVGIDGRTARQQGMTESLEELTFVYSMLTLTYESTGISSTISWRLPVD